MTEWRPISTVPRSFRRVLVSVPRCGMFVANFPPGCAPGNWVRHRTGEWIGSWIPEVAHATHWMPLPPHPKEKGIARGTSS